MLKRVIYSPVLEAWYDEKKFKFAHKILSIYFL